MIFDLTDRRQLLAADSAHVIIRISFQSFDKIFVSATRRPLFGLIDIPHGKSWSAALSCPSRDRCAALLSRSSYIREFLQVWQLAAGVTLVLGVCFRRSDVTPRHPRAAPAHISLIIFLAFLGAFRKRLAWNAIERTSSGMSIANAVEKLTTTI